MPPPASRSSLLDPEQMTLQVAARFRRIPPAPGAERSNTHPSETEFGRIDQQGSWPLPRRGLRLRNVGRADREGGHRLSLGGGDGPLLMDWLWAAQESEPMSPVQMTKNPEASAYLWVGKCHSRRAA